MTENRIAVLVSLIAIAITITTDSFVQIAMRRLLWTPLYQAISMISVGVILLAISCYISSRLSWDEGSIRASILWLVCLGMGIITLGRGVILSLYIAAPV